MRAMSVTTKVASNSAVTSTLNSVTSTVSRTLVVPSVILQTIEISMTASKVARKHETLEIIKVAKNNIDIIEKYYSEVLEEMRKARNRGLKEIDIELMHLSLPTILDVHYVHITIRTNCIIGRPR
jgi:hypothetical protein